MLLPTATAQSKRDVRRIEKRGKDTSKLRTLIPFLAENRGLPNQYKDHALKGTWMGWRDAHIEPDWLLIYQVVAKDCVLPEPEPTPTCSTSSPHAPRHCPQRERIGRILPKPSLARKGKGPISA